MRRLTPFQRPLGQLLRGSRSLGYTIRECLVVHSNFSGARRKEEADREEYMLGKRY